MSTIRGIYDVQPKFPATDQHPLAVRYQVGSRWVDALDGPPTQAEVDAVLGVDPTGQATAARLSADEIERLAAKVDATIMPLVNMDKAAWLTWSTANFPTLTPAERTRLGNLFWVVAVGVRRSIRDG